MVVFSTKFILNIPCDSPHKSCFNTGILKFQTFFVKKRLKVIIVANDQLAIIMEMVNGRVKQTEIWDLGALNIQHIWGTFDLYMFKVIWRSFGALVSKWPVPQKWLACKNKGGAFGTLG